MGTNVTLGVAAGATVAAEAEVSTGLEMGWAVAGSALADGVAGKRALRRAGTRRLLPNAWPAVLAHDPLDFQRALEDSGYLGTSWGV